MLQGLWEDSKVILEAISFCLVILSAIIFHEIGHIYYLRKKLNQRAKLWYSKGFILAGKPKNYIGHTPKQYAGIYGYGIIFGLTPFFLSMIFNAIIPYYLILGLIVYFSGCYRDFINLWRYAIKKKEWVI